MSINLDPESTYTNLDPESTWTEDPEQSQINSPFRTEQFLDEFISVRWFQVPIDLFIRIWIDARNIKSSPESSLK